MINIYDLTGSEQFKTLPYERKQYALNRYFTDFVSSDKRFLSLSDGEQKKAYSTFMKAHLGEPPMTPKEQAAYAQMVEADTITPEKAEQYNKQIELGRQSSDVIDIAPKLSLPKDYTPADTSKMDKESKKQYYRAAESLQIAKQLGNKESAEHWEGMLRHYKNKDEYDRTGVIISTAGQEAVRKQNLEFMASATRSDFPLEPTYPQQQLTKIKEKEAVEERKEQFYEKREQEDREQAISYQDNNRRLMRLALIKSSWTPEQNAEYGKLLKEQGEIEEYFKSGGLTPRQRDAIMLGSKAAKERNLASSMADAFFSGTLQFVTSPYTVFIPSSGISDYMYYYDMGYGSEVGAIESLFRGTVSSLPMNLMMMVNPAVGVALTMSSITSGGIKEDYEAGMLDAQTIMTNILSGAVQTAIEYMSADAQKAIYTKTFRTSGMKALQDAVHEDVKNVFFPTFKSFASAFGASAVEEGMEEIYQNVADRIIRATVNDEEMPDLKEWVPELAYEFAGGFLGAALTGTAFSAIQISQSKKMQQNITKYANQGYEYAKLTQNAIDAVNAGNYDQAFNLISQAQDAAREIGNPNKQVLQGIGTVQSAIMMYDKNKIVVTEAIIDAHEIRAKELRQELAELKKARYVNEDAALSRDARVLEIQEELVEIRDNILARQQSLVANEHVAVMKKSMDKMIEHIEANPELAEKYALQAAQAQESALLSAREISESDKAGLQAGISTEDDYRTAVDRHFTEGLADEVIEMEMKPGDFAPSRIEPYVYTDIDIDESVTPKKTKEKKTDVKSEAKEDKEMAKPEPLAEDTLKTIKAEADRAIASKDKANLQKAKETLDEALKENKDQRLLDIRRSVVREIVNINEQERAVKDKEKAEVTRQAQEKAKEERKADERKSRKDKLITKGMDADIEKYRINTSQYKNKSEIADAIIEREGVVKAEMKAYRSKLIGMKWEQVKDAARELKVPIRGTKAELTNLLAIIEAKEVQLIKDISTKETTSHERGLIKDYNEGMKPKVDEAVQKISDTVQAVKDARIDLSRETDEAKRGKYEAEISKKVEEIDSVIAELKSIQKEAGDNYIAVERIQTEINRLENVARPLSKADVTQKVDVNLSEANEMIDTRSVEKTGAIPEAQMGEIKDVKSAKEAYIKARELTVHKPLAELEFTLYEAMAEQLAPRMGLTVDEYFAKYFDVFTTEAPTETETEASEQSIEYQLQAEGEVRYQKSKTAPKKVVQAYRMGILNEDGTLSPVMVDTKTTKPRYEIGQWYDAEVRKSTMKVIPGFHFAETPSLSQLYKKDGTLAKGRVYYIAEYSADKSYQAEADAAGGNLENQIPTDGYYFRGKMGKGGWAISGKMRPVRILSMQEVDAINRKAGIETINGMPIEKYNKMQAETRHQTENKELLIKGYVERMPNGKYRVGFMDADVTTGLHEQGHIGKDMLYEMAKTDPAWERYVKIAEEFCGVGEDGVWTTNAEEKFANGYVKYITEGKAPTPQLKTVFEKIKDLISKVVSKIAEIMNIELTDDIREVYGALLGAEITTKEDAREAKVDAFIAKVDAADFASKDVDVLTKRLDSEFGPQSRFITDRKLSRGKVHMNIIDIDMGNTIVNIAQVDDGYIVNGFHAATNGDAMDIVNKTINDYAPGDIDMGEKDSTRFQMPSYAREQMEVRRKYEGTDKWMKAPNGKPTNLTERQWIHVQTESFKEWFGNSKVVDENGEPLVVYHGIGGVEGIDRFDPFRLGLNTGSKSAEKGFFFAKDRATADAYANATEQAYDIIREAGRGIKSLIDIAAEHGISDAMHYQYAIDMTGFIIDESTIAKDPEAVWNAAETVYDIVESIKREIEYRIEDGEAIDAEAAITEAELTAEWISNQATEDMRNIEELFLSIEDPATHDYEGEQFRDKNYADVLDSAIKAGKDGAILKNTYDGAGETDIFVAFENTQIKSATDNIGAYDPSTPSIRYQKSNAYESEQMEVRRKYEGTDKWMKAPNGKPTNLTERQWIHVRTESFKSWFGDWENDPKNASKVVDENGEPLAVWHGTKEGGFTIFAKEKLGSNTKSPSAYKGHFFAGKESTSASIEYIGEVALETSSALSNTIEMVENAAFYATEMLSEIEARGYDDGYSEELDLDIRNAAYEYSGDHKGYEEAIVSLVENIESDLNYNIDNLLEHGYSQHDIDEAIKSLKQVSDIVAGIRTDFSFGESGESMYNVFLNVRNPIEHDYFGRNRGRSFNEIIDEGSNAGNDGAIFKRVRDGGDIDNIYVAFDNTQIKSATDNVGSYDPSTPDIRYQKSDAYEKKQKFIQEQNETNAKIIREELDTAPSAEKAKEAVVNAIKRALMINHEGAEAMDVIKRQEIARAIKKQQKLGNTEAVEKLKAALELMRKRDQRFRDILREETGFRNINNITLEQALKMLDRVDPVLYDRFVNESTRKVLVNSINLLESMGKKGFVYDKNTLDLFFDYFTSEHVDSVKRSGLSTLFLMPQRYLVETFGKAGQKLVELAYLGTAKRSDYEHQYHSSVQKIYDLQMTNKNNRGMAYAGEEISIIGETIFKVDGNSKIEPKNKLNAIQNILGEWAEKNDTIINMNDIEEMYRAKQEIIAIFKGFIVEFNNSEIAKLHGIQIGLIEEYGNPRIYEQEGSAKPAKDKILHVPANVKERTEVDYNAKAKHNTNLYEVYLSYATSMAKYMAFYELATYMEGNEALIPGSGEGENVTIVPAQFFRDISSIQRAAAKGALKENGYVYKYIKNVIGSNETPTSATRMFDALKTITFASTLVPSIPMTILNFHQRTLIDTQVGAEIAWQVRKDIKFFSGRGRFDSEASPTLSRIMDMYRGADTSLIAETASAAQKSATEGGRSWFAKMYYKGAEFSAKMLEASPFSKAELGNRAYAHLAGIYQIVTQTAEYKQARKEGMKFRQAVEHVLANHDNIRQAAIRNGGVVNAEINADVNPAFAPQIFWKDTGVHKYLMFVRYGITLAQLEMRKFAAPFLSMKSRQSQQIYDMLRSGNIQAADHAQYIQAAQIMLKMTDERARSKMLTEGKIDSKKMSDKRLSIQEVESFHNMIQQILDESIEVAKEKHGDVIKSTKTETLEAAQMMSFTIRELMLRTILTFVISMLPTWRKDEKEIDIIAMLSDLNTYIGLFQTPQLITDFRLGGAMVPRLEYYYKDKQTIKGLTDWALRSLPGIGILNNFVKGITGKAISDDIVDAAYPSKQQKGKRNK